MELNYNGGGRALRIAVGITILVLLLAGSAYAATLTVNASGGADYTRIQDAIDNSNDGDTILVESGTYFENVNVSKQLILRGIDNGGGNPVVNANGSGSAMIMSAGNSTLEGFIATNSSTGIYVDSKNNIIENNNASNNILGIYLYSSNGNTLRDNIASNNQQGGIFLSYSSNNTLNSNTANLNGYSGFYLYSYYSSNNILSSNNASNNTLGIYLASSNSNTLSSNNVSNNSVDGIFLSSSRNNILNGNSATNNGESIFLLDSSNNMLSNNIVSYSNNGILLSDSSNNTLTNNIMMRNRRNFGLSGIYDNQIDITNLVNEKPIYYIKNSINTIFDSSTNAGTFYCINCINVTIQDMNLSENIVGISFYNTTHSSIQKVNISNNYDGISLASSSNNRLSGNNASNNDIGIYLYYSSNNTIYNNYFNNTNNLYFFGTISNTWNITKTPGKNIIVGPYIGGNVWAHPNGTGFSQTCSDSDSDGICDSPYVLDSNNIDYLPLTVPTAPPTGAPAIISFSPLTSTVMDNVGVTRTFNIITNQAVNVTWQINGTEVFNETSVITSSYTNTSAAQGIWSVTAVVENSNGSAMHKWIWVVTAGPIPPVPEQRTIVLVSAGLLGMLLILRRFGGSELR